MTSRHCANDAKEVDMLGRCGLPLNGGKMGVFNIAIYGKIVRCSFKSFEQCFFFLYNTDCGHSLDASNK